MRSIGRIAILGAAAGALLAASVSAGTAALAHTATPLASSWQIDLKVSGSHYPSFMAVTAPTSSSAWAFENPGAGAPAAYQFSGSTWTKEPFPGKSGDQVMSASSSSAANVWAFTFQGRVLRFNGTTWSTVKKFAKPIGSGLTISKTNVWVFGPPGTWHFNGSAWTKSNSGSGLAGASALSARSIWAYGGTNVAHWNGSTWKRTSLAHLLPKNTLLSHSFLAGIYAASARSVYVIGSGGRQDEGGPLVLLHYNGARWRRLALVAALGNPVAVVPDGSGGLWIPVNTGSPPSASMEHYAHGTVSRAPMPFRPPHLALFAAATPPGSTAAITVGLYRTSFSATTSTAVVLRYRP